MALPVRRHGDAQTWNPLREFDDLRERMSRLLESSFDEAGANGWLPAVDIEETDDAIRATVNGDDLGILIGKHGSTIDALQHLALRIAYKGGAADRQVIVDAAGYRERREMALHRAADRAVSDALDFGRPVELEPMTASERRLVHTYLRDRSEIQTHSEGDEPDRRLVVTPVSLDER